MVILQQQVFLIALSEMSDQGLLQRGDKIIVAGFGGGLTWGGALIEW